MSTDFQWILRGVPRPLLYRGDPVLLDGKWLLDGKPIQVPFPPEAPASGWKGTGNGQFHYEKSFAFEPDKRRPRTFLHFGAVDQVAEVSLNGHMLGKHEGGYLPFSFEITGIVHAGENHLSIDVQDTLDHFYPYGKQSAKPHGMWYTPVSGIWKSAWLENVPERFIRDIHIRSGLTDVEVFLDAEQEGEAEIQIDEQIHLLSVNQWARIEVDDPHLWQPDDPFLYRMDISFGEDRFSSYFALRTVEIKASPAGYQMICLNGKPIYLHGLLDQGYFPEGIYTPESPEQFMQDILNAKALGFNLLRKHIKVEHEAFYAYCDLHGMLVLQDMVNSGSYSFIRDTVIPNFCLKVHLEQRHITGDRMTFFVEHCRGIQRHLENHPCVIGYTIFNEGWGQSATSETYHLLRREDPGRFYISASGWYKGYETDVESEHIYFRKTILKARTRPLLLTEFGGIPCDTGGAREQKAYGYGKDKGPEALIRQIRELVDQMVLPSIRHGLGGCVYTQLTDVEGEINGLYSYDRHICKVDQSVMQEIASRCKEAFADANGLV